MAFHRTLMPGQPFPDVVVRKLGHSQVNLRKTDKPRIIVVYRGSFCPICRETLTHIRDNIHKLEDAGIEIVLVSADNEESAAELALSLNLPPDIDIGYGLTEDQMVRMGLYISDPTNYIPQKHRFSEPATFMLNPDGTIKYLEYSSSPMGGRINIDHYVNGYLWSTQNAIEHPEFASVVWGSAQPEIQPISESAGQIKSHHPHTAGAKHHWTPGHLLHLARLRLHKS